MIWQTVLDVIDAVESWVAGQSYWIQVLLLLGVLGPLCYLVAGFIDRMVEALLVRHGRRDPMGGSRGSPPTAGDPPDRAAAAQVVPVATNAVPAAPVPTAAVPTASAPTATE